MDRSLRPGARLLPALSLAAAALCSVALFLLLFLQIYSSDDYLYLTFLDRGLSGFLADMKWHYAAMNGRLLIHSFACAALHFGHPAVGLLGLAVLWAACLAGLRLCRTEKLPLTGAAVFLAGLLLLPDRVMQQGVLWTAAFYNYVFPIPLLLAALLLLRRQREAARLRPLGVPAAAAAALLSGATTELFGLLSCVLFGWELLWALLRRERRGWLSLLSLLSAAGGLALVFLSPATAARADGELQLSLQALSARLVSLGGLFRSSGRLLLLLVLLQAGLALAGFRRGKLPLLFLCGAGSVLPGLLLLLPEGAAGRIACPALLAVLLAEALLFALRREDGLALLLLAAPLSLLIMLSTDSTHYRTLAGFGVFVLLALAACAEKAKPRPVLRAVPVLLLTAAALAVVLPGLPARLHNYRVDRQNEAQAALAARSGEMELRLDYDLNYSYESIFIPDHRLFSYYRKHYGLDGTTRFRALGHTIPAVYVNGRELEASAFPGGTTVLYPLSALLDALGADWERPAADCFRFTWKGVRYELGPNDGPSRYQNAALRWTDPAGTAHCELTWLVPSSISEERYLTQTALETLLGLRFERTPERIAVWTE